MGIAVETTKQGTVISQIERVDGRYTVALSRELARMPPTSNAILWPYGDSSPRDRWAKNGEIGQGGR